LIVVLVIIVYRRGSTGVVCLPEGGWIGVTVAAAVTSLRAVRGRHGTGHLTLPEPSSPCTTFLLVRVY